MALMVAVMAPSLTLIGVAASDAGGSVSAAGIQSYNYTYDARAGSSNAHTDARARHHDFHRGPTTIARQGSVGNSRNGVASETEATATNSAGHAELAGGMRALLAERAGFTGTGPRILVDENLPGSWAAGLREAGYDARSVSEMGLRGASDPQLGQLADQVGARVLTRDVGHDVAGGFGSNGIVIDSRVRSLDTILRILEGG